MKSGLPGRTTTGSPVVPAARADPRPLRTVIEDHCFLDTDGVIRNTARMIAIMDGWCDDLVIVEEKRAKKADRQRVVRDRV